MADILLLPYQVLETEPLMVAEDFAYFAQAVPSAFMFIGIRNESLGAVHNLHSLNFVVDEEVLHIGAAVHAAVAMEYLSRQQEGFHDVVGARENEL